MEESEQEHVFDESGEGRFVAGSSRGMSDEDADDTILDSTTESTSKKRKKVGVWKAMKRFFSRKSSKGSKSFSFGDSLSPQGQPQRSNSDPNLAHTSGERPDVAPLEQGARVGEAPMETDAAPKKAMSHDSLLSELRSKQRINVEINEESSKPSAVDWQASPSPSANDLLPGLNVSHDKIRVAPRHRRAPTRKGASSVRAGGQDIVDGEIMPRSKSVGGRTKLIVEQTDENISGQGKENVLEKEKERKNLKKKVGRQRSGQEKSDHENLEKQKIEDERLKQEKLERERTEQEKIEQETFEKEKLEDEKRKKEKERLEQEKLKELKLEDEKRKLEKLEKERLEQEKLEKLKLEEEKRRQENLEKERLQQEKLRELKLEEEKREKEKLEMEKLEQEKLKELKLEEEKCKQEKLEKERLEQEKLEKERLEQEKLEKERLEQERLEKLKLEEEKRRQEKLEEEKLKKMEEEKSGEDKKKQLQTTDFSDLVESLKPSNGAKEIYTIKRAEAEDKGTVSEPEKLGEINKTSEVEPSDVRWNQNIDSEELNVDVDTKENYSIKQLNTKPVDGIVVNTADDRKIDENSSQDVRDFTVSSFLSVDNPTASSNEGIYETDKVKVVEQSKESQPMLITHEEARAEIATGKQPESVPAVDKKLGEIDAVVTFEKKDNHPGSPPLSPPVSPPSARSPVRTKRLVIETPEKVYQKPIMADIATKEAEIVDDSRGVQPELSQSMHNRITTGIKEKNQSQDDSNIGVSRLTQAFERSSRSQTISYRTKPDVLPKPKVASKPDKSKTLDRSYRFPVTANTTQNNAAKQNNVVINSDEVHSKNDGLLSPTKKIPVPKPKPLPKPQPKPKVNTQNVTTKTVEEGNEQRKKAHSTQSVTNGSVKCSGSTEGKHHTGGQSKDAESDLPSFWARRNIFSPEQKSNSASTSSQEEKSKEKHTPFIQLKTDTCAVCGSKVYQMEKFKVKDNIVHRSCIKCSVCKRLLSVGNFIFSQNKIYCKPHEPNVPISLATV
ncbi:calponin homology domain-containing protein DDB_G0272472-like isoform X2 [Dendronephthya gigantea]|nr:calponin homology domain-containing protein DDB_G0272472-like isoform X2 [Dendronephthya gigantea]